MTQGIRILPHSAHDYEMLPKRVRRISEKERAFLDEIGAVLVEHGKHERFAISLLHRHFEYADDELCFVTSDADKQSVTVNPVKRTELDGQSITAISCRFVQSREDEAFKLIGLEYAPVSDMGQVEPISEGDAACLEAIYQLLVRNDAVNTFGVVLRHIDPRTTENLEWMEDSFPATRISVRRLMHPSDLPKENIGTSNWSFTKNAIVSATSCTGSEHFHCVSSQHCSSSCDPKDPEDDKKPAPEEPADQ